MFKNLLLYRIAPDWTSAPDAMAELLGKMPFIECGATQPLSAGWVPPRGEAHGTLVEAIDGQWLAQLQIEKKPVPGPVLRRRVEEMAAHIEQTTGRKPGKKAQRELKDQALLELLPMAFAKRAAVKVWIAPKERLLALDAGSQAYADEVLTHLAQALPGFAAQMVNTALSPATAMADWLVSGEPPAGFSIDRDCELKAADGEKSVVRYARHPLDLPEIRTHIEAGKRPTRLALTWNDRISFVLTEGLQIKKLAFLDGVFEGRATKKGENYDADAAIATGEMAPLIGELLDALGGEQALGALPVAAAEAAPAPATAATSAAKTTLPPWEAAAA